MKILRVLPFVPAVLFLVSGHDSEQPIKGSKEKNLPGIVVPEMSTVSSLRLPPPLIKGETVLEVEESFRLNDKEVHKKLLSLKVDASNDDYKKSLFLARDTINSLENLTPGANTHIKSWLLVQKDLKGISQLPFLERYIERLAIHGETDLDDALYSFTATQALPVESLMDNLLKLHRYSGVLRVNRLVDLSKSPEEKHKALESTVNEFIRNFEDKDYKKNDRVLAVYLTGVIQEGEEGGKDMFAVGGDLLIKDLQKNGYKIFLFEIDKDSQIIEGAKRVQKATGKSIDLVMFCGHGTNTTTNFGLTERLISKRRPDAKYMDYLKRKHSDYARTISTEELWKIDNIASGGLTEDSAHLDTGDIGIMKSLKPLLSADARAVFASCSVGNEENGASLARTVSKNTNVITFGCTVPIRGLILQYDSKKLVTGVTYLSESFEKLGADHSKVYLPK